MAIPRLTWGNFSIFLAQILLWIFDTVHPVHVKVLGREVIIGETKKKSTLVDILSADGGDENTAEAFYWEVKDDSQESKMSDFPTLSRGHAKARFGGKRMKLENWSLPAGFSGFRLRSAQQI